MRNHSLEEGKQYPSRSASSTIEGSTTLDMTSMSITAADTGTRRNVATTLTMVGVTTVTKTECHRNCQAVESLAEQYAAHRCQACFDPQPESPSTLAKPSRSCG